MPLLFADFSEAFLSDGLLLCAKHECVPKKRKSKSVSTSSRRFDAEAPSRVAQFAALLLSLALV